MLIPKMLSLTFIDVDFFYHHFYRHEIPLDEINFEFFIIPLRMTFVLNKYVDKTIVINKIYCVEMCVCIEVKPQRFQISFHTLQ